MEMVAAHSRKLRHELSPSTLVLGGQIQSKLDTLQSISSFAKKKPSFVG